MKLLEDVGAFLSGGGINSAGKWGVRELAAAVGDAAGSDLESKELAAIMCVCVWVCFYYLPL